MHNITKDFDFCYGHRVWTQKLNAELSVNQPCKCRHLHGHQGKITIKLEAETLENGMVTDFHHLNWFKVWLDDFFDHKMILDFKDPLLIDLLHNVYGSVDDPRCWSTHHHLLEPEAQFYTPNMNTLRNNTGEFPKPIAQHQLEFLEGLCVVNFIPTSENLSRFFFIHVEEEVRRLQEAFGFHVMARSVTFQETPKTSATFSA